jgi:hypothetical protein
MLFRRRWDETHFLEPGEQTDQHFFRVHPFQKTVQFGCRHTFGARLGPAALCAFQFKPIGEVAQAPL